MRKSIFGPCVYKIGRGKRRRNIHTHVQRSVCTIGETPLCFVKLKGGHPKVEEDSIHPFGSQRTYDILEIGKIRMLQDKGIPYLTQDDLCMSESFLILIETNEEPSIQALKKCLCMASKTNRRIDKDFSRSRGEDLYDFREEDRDVHTHASLRDICTEFLPSLVKAQIDERLGKFCVLCLAFGNIGFPTRLVPNFHARRDSDNDRVFFEPRIGR